MQTNVIRLPEALTQGGQRRARRGIGTMGDVVLQYLETHGVQNPAIDRIAEHRDEPAGAVGWRECIMLAMFEALSFEQQQAVRRTLVGYRYKTDGRCNGSTDALAIVGLPIEGHSL